MATALSECREQKWVDILTVGLMRLSLLAKKSSEQAMTDPPNAEEDTSDKGQICELEVISSG